MQAVALQLLDFDFGIVGQTLPTDGGQLLLEFREFASPRAQHVAAIAFALLEEGQGFLADHAAIHDPDATALAETLFDVGDDRLDGLQILLVAGEGFVRQRKAFARHHQGQHDLLAIAALVARVAASGHFVGLHQALEVTAGEIVEQEFVIELEQLTEMLFQIVLDAELTSDQAVESAIETILGDDGVGDAEQIFESGRGVPMFGEGEFAARLAEPIDDFDGDDVGGPHRLLSLRHMAVDDRVEAEHVPKPAGQVDVAEGASVGPADGVEAKVSRVGVVARDRVVIGEEPEFLCFALAVVEGDGALPSQFLIGVEFAEMCDDALPRAGVGAHALDQREIGVRLSGFLSSVASEKHPCLQP